MIKYRDKSGQVHKIQDGVLFVTKDKNGDDVFAEDKVKANGIIAIVKEDKRECRYMLSTIPSLCEYPPALYDNMGSKFLWSDIELIKDEEK